MKIKILNCVINCFIILSWWVAGFASESSIQIVATESLTYPVGSAAFTDAEYFIDTDPGVGQATTITYTISDNRATINKSITLDALAEGLHVLYVRFKDSETGWGPARGTSFIVVSGSTVSYQISRAEYYIDTDPGKGQATALTISSADANVVVTGDYNTSSLANGEHTLYVRFYNDKSGWGPARGTKFYIATAATDYAIAGAEYFFDTDPGKGNGTAISVPSDGAFDESIEEFSITPNLPAIGQHQLFLRLRDNFGRWGPPRAVNFEVKESQVTDLIISGAEYYIDTDPGKGTGTAIPAPVDGTYDEAVEDVTANFNVAGLPEGRHIVYVRTKDSRGHWGPARGTPFIVSTEAQPVITAAEYFFNADPGEGNGIQLPAEDGAYNTTDEEGKIVLPVASTGLAVGNHRVYVRFKNSRGTWGPKKSADFSIVVKPVIELSLTSIAFGTVFIGDSAKENFVIRNRGDANLTISTITAPTGYTTNFKTAQGTIVPGDSLIVTVTFRPTAETNYNGNLVIANNDVQKSIALTGRGSTVPVSKITMTPTAPLNFGNVDIFTDVSKSLQVKITNTGTKKLWISKIVSSDTLTFNHDFPALTDSIAINGFVTFHVIFTPKDTISYTGYLTINNNSPTASYQYDLVGQGVGTFAPHIATLSDVINFGTVQVGSSSAKKLLIANTGTINLSLSSIISSNPDITTNLSASNNTVTPKDTNEIIVTFQPTSAANYNASLQINSNDTPNSPKIVSVSGIGSATPVPDIQVSASTLNFGNIKLDAPAVSRTVTIYNKGTANLNISSIATDDAVFTDNISGSQILPSNGNLTVQVTFKPTASKVYDANLIIQNNDPDDATLNVALHGSSIFPEIFLLTSNLNFGNVPVTTASDLTITVENEGTDTLKISGFQKSSELTGVISITPTSYNILPSASKNFKATFTPVNPILYTGEIIILNNDQPETVHVSGQGIDNIPPTITFDPSVLAANPVAINTPIAISASAQDNNKIDWVRLYYRKAGIAKFDSVTLTQSGSNFSGTIPSARVSERGVEYYLKAFDGANYRTIPATAPTVPAIVRVRVPALPPKTMLAEKYEMFSIPSDLNLKNVKSILETSLGTYDINVWRLFRWINGAYVELKDDESFAFDPGKAYWLITAEQKVLTFDTSLSVRTDQDYEMSLYQGWNQVGTPFYFPIDWTDVFTASGSDVVQGGVAFMYDGSGWVHADQLNPFGGYFIYTTSGGNNLKIPARESGQNIHKQSMFAQLSADEWTIQLKAFSGRNHDQHNFLGVRRASADEWDITDMMDPPPIGNSYVNVFFPNTNWLINAGQYSGDFKAVKQSGNYFDFSVVAAKSDGSVTLRLETANALPQDYRLYLIDKERRISQTITLPAELILKTEGGRLHKNYRLVAGTADFYERNNLGVEPTPQTFALSRNYPNPFNPRTTLEYQLPEPCRVSLCIYNNLGQRVRTFADNELKYPGYYQVIWDGLSDKNVTVASGVYWCMLKAGDFVQTRKMLFIK